MAKANEKLKDEDQAEPQPEPAPARKIDESVPGGRFGRVVEGVVKYFDCDGKPVD